MQALQRARMPHRLLSVQADDWRTTAPQIEGMLRALPFQTIGDIARHGLELHRLLPDGLEVMHVILAITQDGMGVVRTNVGPNLLRSMGEELVDLSGRIEPPRPGDAKH